MSYGIKNKHFSLVGFVVSVFCSLLYLLSATSSWADSSESITIKLFGINQCTMVGLKPQEEDSCLGIDDEIVLVRKDDLVSMLYRPKEYAIRMEPGRKARLSPELKKLYILEFCLVAVKENERCVESGHILKAQRDVVFKIKGERRIPLKRVFIKRFLENPGKYFSQSLSKGALFNEDMNRKKALSMFWLYAGLYVFMGLIFGALSAQKAVEKGFSPKYWFSVGFVFNILAFISVLLKKEGKHLFIPKGLKKIHHTSDPITCPECGYENHPLEKSCVDCGHSLSVS